jgi:16S rRNA processing protein RimM
MTQDGSASAPTDLVELGVVRGAYGLKGEAKIHPFDADATVLRLAPRWWLVGRQATQSVEVVGVRSHGDVLLAKWQGWYLPEPIDAIKGARVAVPRSEFPPLPEGEYYWTDLIGSTVLNRDGVQLGRVTALSNNGAQDLLNVEGEFGLLLVPLVAAYLDAVDVPGRLIRVDWQVDWL